MRCPECGMPSWRVHGRYTRQLRDAPDGLTPAVITLVVRRFRCSNSLCAAVTFAEQVEGLTRPHARYTPLLRQILRRSRWCWRGAPGPDWQRCWVFRWPWTCSWACSARFLMHRPAWSEC
ncbi:transposase family protein [Streptomyces monashensis]|uniref:transposase family protein n=1 Tax=Streptomyces monashensis TaxID=1678012 RepID=UPI003CCC2578